MRTGRRLTAEPPGPGPLSSSHCTLTTALGRCNLQRSIVTDLAAFRRDSQESSSRRTLACAGQGRCASVLGPHRRIPAQEGDPPMAEEDGEGLRERLARQGEDALGKLAQDLLENPIVSGAITRAFTARERATQAQEAAMGALNLPSAADLERLTRRLRSVSQRLEGIEDAVDRLEQRLEALGRSADGDLSARLGGVESQLATLSAEIGQLSAALDARPAPVPREQE